jgi:putative acetyltransferase
LNDAMSSEVFEGSFTERWQRRRDTASGGSASPGNPADVSIQAETPDQPEIAAFFAQSEAYMSALYPAESNHFAPLTVLLGPDVLFLVARRRGTAIGCGAIVRSDDGTAEIKRMWTAHEARGAGVGRALLAALEDAARSDGLTALRLETGIAQPEAISLYRSRGYADVGPFGGYVADPLSLFMEKRLA